MKNITVLVSGLLMSVASAGFAQLKVDFDGVDATGVLVANSVTEFGFQSFGAQNQTSGQTYDLFRTVVFSTVSWGNVSITISSDANPAATNFAQVPRAVARTAAQLGAYNGVLPDLIRDWAAVDTRPAGAGATTLNVGISALPAGQYELISYHQDPADQTGQFDILVNGTQVATNVDIHSSAGGENPGANNPPFFAVTPFTSDGSTPTTISFRLATTNSTSDSERLMILNGFVLAERGAGLLVYSFGANPTTAFAGTPVTLSWVTRSNASVAIDLIGDVTPYTTNGVGSLSVTPSDFGFPDTTVTFTLSATDTNTFESEFRSLAVRVQPDISAFAANPRTIHAGEATTISWTVHPGAGSISIDQGIGSVLAQTTNGVGSFTFAPAATANYTLTVDRSGNISQTNVTVVVIPGGGTGTLTNDIVSYWPLDEVLGSKTPDLVNGYDFTLEGSTLPVLVPGGYKSNAFQFSGAGLLARIHGANDDLPANKHDSFTVSMWVMVDGPPLDDKRVFSEGNTANNNPLFNLGTMGGLPGDARGSSMSVFIRRPSNVVENNHTFTSGQPFDNTWHHVVFVQSNGVRTVYVDAIPDSTVITNKDPAQWQTNSFNTTSVGAIRRSSATAYIIGQVDEVAIWKRALSPTEIGEVYLDGVPTPGSSSGPLVINSFVADFPAVVAGDTVMLRWDASPDASLSIDNGIGNVDAYTSFGLGSLAVPVNGPTLFTLTASRTGDTPVAKNVFVTVVSGVAPGWRLLDNFETYQPGPILNQSKWNNGTGVATVLDRGGNKVLGFTQTANDIRGAGLLSAIPLDSLSLTEGQIGTLFFRIYASGVDPVSDVTLHAGLTDRPARFVGDFANNIGPYIRLQKPATLVTNITVLAPDGVGNPLTNAAAGLEYGKVYNVWINVTNDLIASNDLFAVYVQAPGDPGRTLLFENLRGDRNPVADETGPVGSTLNKAFFALMNLNQGRENLLVDDLYISLGAYRDTVPVPAGPFERMLVLAAPSPAPGGFRFSWNSEVGATYTVRTKENLSDPWQILATNYPAGGATSSVMSYTNTPLSTARRFYQAVAEPRPAVWSTDFESGAAGWVVIDNSFGSSPTLWELGTPSGGPGAAHSGANAYGTDLDANYAQLTDTALRSPVIDLTGITNQARIEFWQYLSIEPSDIAQVNILDQSDIVIAQPAAQQSGIAGGWNFITFPLPAAALNQPIKIEFRMADADFFNAQSLPGWFIDDVVIRR